MGPMQSSIVSVATLVISIILVALAATNFYLLSHGTQLMDYWFPSGRYAWWVFEYTDPYPWAPRESGHFVSLEYDTTTETQLMAATGLTIAAGVFGVAAFWIIRKNQKSLLTLVTTGTAFAASTVAFLASLVCLSIASFTHDKLSGSCNASLGIKPDFHFKCTRELAACSILQTSKGGITETNWADNRRCCRETKGARLLLIPFVILSFGLAGLYAVKLWNLKQKHETTGDADDRVERLRRDSE